MLGSGFVFLVILLQNLDPLSAVRIHCQNIERMHEENIHHCCKHPDGHNDVTESCAMKTNFRLPSADEEAVEDVTVNQVMSGTCWAKCVVDHYNLLENNTLDMGKVRSYYKRYHTIDPEYEAEMVNAYEKCHSKSETALEQFLAMPLVTEFIKTKMCKPTSSIILSCVIYNFFHNCPRSRWAHTSECEETLAFTKKCKDAFTTM